MAKAKDPKPKTPPTDGLDQFIDELQAGEPGEAPANLEHVRSVLEETQAKISRALELIAGRTGERPVQLSTEPTGVAGRGVDGRVIEGVFNGEAMVGADGKRYSVPPNYASKSKLAEGDILKLTITGSGAFIYKQIAPIERDRLVATLARDEISGGWYAVDGNRRWRLLTASVTYFRGTPGDEVVVIIPRHSKSLWAAVENIIKH